MANWISNKLKVAETFLQQIDQQAAESLGKGETPRSDDLKLDVASKNIGTVSIKDQLKKKSEENSDYNGKLNSDPSFKVLDRNNSFSSSSSSPKLKPKPKSNTLTDSDWTELLGTPNPAATALGINRKDGSRGGGGGGIVNGGKKPSDGEESSSSGRSSSVELLNDGKSLEGRGVKPKGEGSGENDGVSKDRRLETVVGSGGGGDAVSDVKIGVNGVRDRLRSTVRGNHKSDGVSVTSVPNDMKRGSSSVSDDSSDSGSDSGSSSGSASEREREERRRRREKILAEKAAAKAAEVVKERENMVARLEGEKQSLEKILDERAKQQAKEASELQSTMMETMDAVELEKQKHNNTRMEVFARLAKLETTNADLARSVATTQKKLEVENDQVAELRQQIELKEVAHEELRRRISNTHQTGTYLNQVAASKGTEFEREILEAEYAFITDKIVQLQDKAYRDMDHLKGPLPLHCRDILGAKKLEANIEMTRKEIEEPTEVEIELKRRLGQLTDHLIQKQAQVESLSSEKSTLLFRIEAVSRLLDENKSMASASSSDLESGTWDLSQTKLRPLFEDKIRSGRKHLGSLVRQLDAIFLAGAVFLRRNPTAKLWSLVYLVCLHFWVVYILMSHPQSSDEARSGAVFSLENINRTAG
ncbi:hypothetical protein JRO89_XS13G0025000 [Xanthoceras sorbifolium]|uniref:Golgin candidate 2 n=1 Tax=Xanthoceras sorbifolium TaxID=99658 RepID=A0ABQ8H651_9ROSI|nr:hypothetical protein JRO89_XS13G0025000 [Xanthoceras sorbifolium]